MINKRVLFVISICIFILLCFAIVIFMNKEKRIIANDDLSLSENEIIELSEKAINGDGESAYSIASYFLFIKYDTKEAEKWLKLGADNNNVKCQYNYATLLLELNEKQNYEQAVYYLQLAANNGLETAKTKIEKLGKTY